MNINELQELVNSTMKAVKDNGCYLDNGIVKENKEIYVVSVEGQFYDEYLGDSDWVYREVSGDIIISDEDGLILIDNIYDVDDSDTEDYEDKVIKASETLHKILVEEEDDFERIYCIECAEFYNVKKSKDYVKFCDKSSNDWDLEITIEKKQLNSVKEFNIDKKTGCF